ncbi:hypothetical protein FS837_007290 [Tulasnella sp. UAMH 9824]|nr:hypothetical protein FS837_007290 [Tulasnella sp. UAMH 9824]
MGSGSTKAETSTTSPLPSPSFIGGFPTEVDYIPSIVLFFLFTFSLSPWIRRQYDPNTRTVTLGLATTIFAMGRQLLYSFRYLGAHTHYPGEELSLGMLVYEQIGFAVGYMGVMMDVIAFARAVLVNATLEDLQRGSKDRPRLRGRIRWILWYPAFTLFAVSMIGTMNYVILGPDGRARVFQILRYSCDVPALATIVAFIGGLLYVRPRLKYLDKPALDAIIKLSITLAVTPIYRISVLHYTSPSLLVQPAPPYPPGSLTSTSAKIIFYIFHAFPEVLVVYYVHCINIRAKFNTGPYGDWYQADAKYGIPQLREEGVIVHGVGVPPVGEPGKPPMGLRLRSLFMFEPKPSRIRDTEKDEFDPERESLLTLVPTRSTASGESDKTWW